MSPTDDLKAEHEGILLMLKILETLTARMRSGKKVPVEHLRQILEFLRVFADQCHHGKEEDILFPAMEKAGIPREGGPIGVMLSEHHLGRDYIRKMGDALEGYEKGSASGDAFADPAMRYIELLRQHILKENNVLFPMAEKSLPQTEQNRLKEEFDRFETEKIGAGRHEAFHALMDELSGIYLGK